MIRALRKPRFAVATCLLFAAALLEAGWHAAEAEHRYCPEHGELVHGHGHDHQPERAQQRASTEPSLSQRAPHLESAHGCAALDFLSQLQSLSSRRPRQLPTAGDERSPHRTLLGGYVPIAPLVLSPKASPPSADLQRS
jgi:hypothetical protein